MREIIELIIYLIVTPIFLFIAFILFSLFPEVVINTLGFFSGGAFRILVFCLLLLAIALFFINGFKYIVSIKKGPPEEKEKKKSDFILFAKAAMVSVGIILIAGIYANR